MSPLDRDSNTHGDHDDDNAAFIAGTLAAIRAESAAAQEAHIEDTLRAAPRPGAAPPRTRRQALRYALTALAAGILAAALTYAATRPGEPAPRDDAFALDGGAGHGGDRIGAPTVITTDAQGRPTEIARKSGDRLDGERVLFRAGNIIRIEHYRDGQLDGPQLDFDGLGRLVALHTYAAGVLRGPFLELAPDGSVRSSGIR